MSHRWDGDTCGRCGCERRTRAGQGPEGRYTGTQYRLRGGVWTDKRPTCPGVPAQLGLGGVL